jgi:radical SAM superfamily enzyme YgiQ (UPF0313 family)
LHDLYLLGFRRITLADDTIAVDKEWAQSLFSAIARSNPGYRLKVRARADELTDDLIDRMVDAGVEVVQFGVESINLTTREFMHKKLGQDAISFAFNAILKRPGLFANPLYMLAYPGETWEDLSRNATFIKEMGADSRVMTYVSFTTPYPGTGFDRSVTEQKGIALTRSLRYYTNKFPVFIPKSLLTVPAQQALAELVQIYNEIAGVVNRAHFTQYPIPDEFFREVEKTNEWTST